MDIERVNGFLARAQSQLAEGESYVAETLLAEMDDTHAPDGDPEDGASPSGVNNSSNVTDSIIAFINATGEQVASQFDDLSAEDATSFALDFADEQAKAGKLPAFPDPDTSSDEDMLKWLTAAKASGFASSLVAYISSDS